MTVETTLPVLKPTDFASDQDVRWCPGCGDYAILAQLPARCSPSAIGVPQARMYVFISGIGCSSRFPYYMETFGMHSHPRSRPRRSRPAWRPAPTPNCRSGSSPATATGLSIGGNHMMHAIRRNMDMQHRCSSTTSIYGLTKGQYSPTSEQLGKKTKSTRLWVRHRSSLAPDQLSIAIGCGATFVARSIDTDVKHAGGMNLLPEVLGAAADHRGTAFVEVYQNCNVFNDGAWNYAKDRDVKHEYTLQLEHGKPLIFGRDRDKGIRLNGLDPEVVELGKGITEDDLLFHDEQSTEPSLAYLLSRMRHEDGYPEPIGVFRCVEKPRYDDLMNAQIEEAIAARGEGDLDKLFHTGDTWEVG